MSPSKRHDPSAIWAHLKPILEQLKNKGIETVHFFSDGPVTQYRNRDNFYFMKTFYKEMGFKNATWNFSEPSHGKGAPDGVGAAVKRVADGLVSKGTDIPDAERLYRELQGKTNVKLFYIPESEILEMDTRKATSGNSDPIKGIMKISQIILQVDKLPTLLFGRELSCFCKKFPAFCRCHDIFEIISSVSRNENQSTQTTRNPDNASVDQFQIDNWIIVDYENTIYPGRITDIDREDQSFEVNVLHSVGENKYVWPAKEDKIWYTKTEVLSTIEPPIQISKRILSFQDPFWLRN